MGKQLGAGVTGYSTSSVRKGFLEVEPAGVEGGMRKGIVDRMFKKLKPASRLWHLGEQNSAWLGHR